MPWRHWYYVVNPLSGGRQGAAVGRRLRELVGEHRVADVISGDVTALLARAQAERQPVIVVGGDGTAAGVMNRLMRSPEPVPVGMLPLGTGNDLARYLGLMGWRHDRPEEALAGMTSFREEVIDRWRLTGPEIDDHWYNYCSFGADARIAYHFHHLRQRHPSWFRSPAMNRVWYGGLGLVDRPRSLRKALLGSLAEKLPAGTRSLVLTNISSYAGGTCLSQRIDAADGRFEMMALPDGLPLVLRLQHLRPATMLTQVSRLRVQASEQLHLQIDGEARSGRPGVYTISPAGTAKVLAKGDGSSTMHPALDGEAGPWGAAD